MKPFAPDFVTWFNQQMTSTRPPAAHMELPSNFQIGDEVEIVADNLDLVSGVVYAVRFAANGTVSYDLAVPIAGTSHFAIMEQVRGSMRAKGASDSAEDLSLIGVEELRASLIKAGAHLSVVQP